MPGCCNSKLTRQEWFTLIVIGSVHFASAICVSLQAPFYPELAESKNATASEYGLVFGVYELTAFICSPLFGNYMDAIGAKCLLNTGVLVAATSAILFGFLDYVEDRVWFITLSFILRIFEAMGSSAAVTSAFSITAATFPDSMATTFATLEIFYGLGIIVGPTLGGIMFSLGGYLLPFLVMGSVLLLDSVFIYFVLPSSLRNRAPREGKLLEILKVPAVLLDSLSIASVSLCMGFYSATLEPHIRRFMLTPVALGFVFVTNGAMYALTAPLIGRLCDKYLNPRYIILFGNSMVIISVLFVGPAPFFPIETELPLVIVGLLFLGLGTSCVLVPAFTDAIRSAVSYGLPNDIVTFGLVSGLWASSFSLGDFIGPSVAGFLTDFVGFRVGSMFVIIVQIFTLTCMSIFCIRSRRSQIRQNAEALEAQLSLMEKKPLNAPAECLRVEYGANKQEQAEIPKESLA